MTHQSSNPGEQLDATDRPDEGILSDEALRVREFVFRTFGQVAWSSEEVEVEYFYIGRVVKGKLQGVVYMHEVDGKQWYTPDVNCTHADGGSGLPVEMGATLGEPQYETLEAATHACEELVRKTADVLKNVSSYQKRD